VGDDAPHVALRFEPAAGPGGPDVGAALAEAVARRYGGDDARRREWLDRATAPRHCSACGRRLNDGNLGGECLTCRQRP
jgi:hypothetical protein